MANVLATEEELRKYYKSKNNMFRVVQYRGYVVPEEYIPLKNDTDNLSHEEEELPVKMTYTQFISKYQSSTLKEVKDAISDYVFEHAARDNDSIIVRWHPERKVGPSIRNLVDIMEHGNIMKAIIIADEGSTPMCKNIIRNVKSVKGMTIDVWDLADSQIFVPDDVTIPIHRILSVKEKAELMRKYAVDKTQLPEIERDDVMVKYLGALKGNLIECKRVSQSEPTFYELYYRMVK